MIDIGLSQIERFMLFINLMFGIGLAAFTAAGMMMAGGAAVRVLGLSPALLRLAGGLVLIVIIGFVVFGARRCLALGKSGRTFTMPDATIGSVQLLLTTIDLAAAGGSLWFLLPAGRPDFPTFAVLFSAATALGVVSRVPAGLGVFDAVIFCALERYVAPDRVVAALLLYRGVYFVLPVLLAAGSLASFELRRTGPDSGSNALARLEKGVGLLAPLFLSAVTFSVGAMLIMSGATPAVDWRLAALQAILPLWAVETSHLLSTLGGVLFLFVARGLYHRLDGAWWLAFATALASAVLCLAKGLAFAETAALVLLIFLLLATRSQFTRPSAFLRQPFTVGWCVAVVVVLVAATGVLLFAFRDVPYRREIWWQFEFDAQASRSLRAILAASIFALAISLWQLLRTASGRVELPSARDLSRAAAVIHGQQRSGAMLALMGDKSLLFSNSGESFLMFAKRGRSWIALFDPIGPRGEWPELVRRFIDLVDRYGGRAAFYQVRAESLPFYLDAGLRIAKIGEEAFIDLEQFGLDGPQRYGLRQALKRAERDNVSCEVLSPPRSATEEDFLHRISNAWLVGHRCAERQFSVAAFEPRFIAAQSVILARQCDRPMALVTYMTTGCQSEATVGLMRQVPEAPPYVMELMITRLAVELRARNFKTLILGMAPLAGLVRAPLSSPWHRAAGLLWEHGEAIYNFQGLRAFKSKFRPT